MKKVCDLCDESIETGSKHKLHSTEAKRHREACPYCKEQNVPLCRLGPVSLVYVCARCRSRWMREEG